MSGTGKMSFGSQIQITFVAPAAANRSWMCFHAATNCAAVVPVVPQPTYWPIRLGFVPSQEAKFLAGVIESGAPLISTPKYLRDGWSSGVTSYAGVRKPLLVAEADADPEAEASGAAPCAVLPATGLRGSFHVAAARTVEQPAII